MEYDFEWLIDDKVIEERNRVLESGDFTKIYSFIKTHTFEEAYPLIEYLWKSGNSLYNLGYADLVYQGCYNDLFYGRTVSYTDISKIRRSFESVINSHNSLGCLQFLGWFREKSLIHQNVMINGELIEKDFGYEILGSFSDLIRRSSEIAMNDEKYTLECSEILNSLPDWVEMDNKVLIRKQD